LTRPTPSQSRARSCWAFPPPTAPSPYTALTGATHHHGASDEWGRGPAHVRERRQRVLPALRPGCGRAQGRQSGGMAERGCLQDEDVARLGQRARSPSESAGPALNDAAPRSPRCALMRSRLSRGRFVGLPRIFSAIVDRELLAKCATIPEMEKRTSPRNGRPVRSPPRSLGHLRATSVILCEFSLD